MSMPVTPVTAARVPRQPIQPGFSLGAVGDVMYLRPMSATLRQLDPALTRLLASVDVLFGNLETSVADLAEFTGSPAAESGGTWLLAPSTVASDLRSLGFDLMSLANNHAGDWGTEGLLSTLRHTRRAGLVSAGAGHCLSAALAPSYLDTAHGRIALVAATTSFTAQSRAGDPLGEIPGRPGVAAIRSSPVATIPAQAWETLRELAGAEPSFLNRVHEDEVLLMGGRYRPGVTGQATPMVAYEPHPGDVEQVLTAVRQARQNSNLVIFSLHSHEPSNDDQRPAAFAADLARRAIDSGADVVIGHGPHQLRGIEIYRSAPILHSLGDFAMMSNSMDLAAPDTWEQCATPAGSMTVPEMLNARNDVLFTGPQLLRSVAATLHWEEDTLDIHLHPLDLGRERTGASRGVPRSAGPEAHREILAHLGELSSEFGTMLEIDGDHGIVHIDLEERHAR